MGIDTLVWLFVAIVGVVVIIRFAINQVKHIEQSGMPDNSFLHGLFNKVNQYG